MTVRQSALQSDVLHALLDGLPVGLALLDADLRFRYVNGAFAALAGLPAEDHIGRSARDVLPALPTALFESIRAVADGAPPMRGDEFGENTAAPGVRRLWLGDIEPVRDDRGGSIGVRLALTEVTADRRADGLIAGLQRLADVLTRARTPDQVVEAAADVARQTLAVDFGGVRLLSDDASRLDLVALLGAADAHPDPRVSISMDEVDPRVRAASTGEVAVYEGASEIARAYPLLGGWVGEHGTVVAAGLPGGRGPIGSFLFGWRRRGLVGLPEREFIRAAARLCGQAIDRIHEAIEEHDRSVSITRAMTALAAEATPVRMAEVLLAEAMAGTHGQFGMIRLVDDDESRSVLHRVGYSDEVARKIDALAGRSHTPTTVSMATREPVLLRDRDEVAARFPDLLEAYDEVGQRASAAFPLRAAGETVGAMLVGYREAQPMGDAEVAYLAALAEAGAAALERARLHQVEARVKATLEQTLAALPVGVVVVDPDLKVVYENPAAVALGARALALGGDRRPAGKGDAAGDGRVALDEVVHGATMINREVHVRRLDGRETVLGMSASPIVGPDGAALGAVAVLTDVTEARRASEARDAFLGMLSHELRTPVTAIFGGTVLLERSANLEGPLAEVAADVHAESVRLLRLVDDLLVLARVERGTLTLEHEPILLHHVLATTLEEERGRWPGARIELASPATLPMFLGDAGYIAIVIRNLVGNGVKYGNGLVRVTASSDGSRLSVLVEDDGPGLDLAPHQLFTLFGRGPTAKRRAPGSGLGLFVCRALVEAMGGSITTTRGSLGGAAFLVTLPLEGAFSVDDD